MKGRGGPSVLAWAVAALVLVGRASAQGTPEAPVVIGVVGASVSAGFASGSSLARELEEAVKGPREIADGADFYFFARPRAAADDALARIKARKIDALVALDFVFWFGAGPKTLDQRVKAVEGALAMLDGFEVPVLVGTIPRLDSPSLAIPKASRIPESERGRLNEVIREWAAKNGRRSVLAVDAWAEAICAGRPIVIPGEAGPRVLRRHEVFDDDGVHLTAAGLELAARPHRRRPAGHDHVRGLGRRDGTAPRRRAGPV